MVATSVNVLKRHISHKLHSLARSYKAKDIAAPAKLRKRTSTTGAKLMSTLRTMSMRNIPKKVSEEASQIPSPSNSTAKQARSRKKIIRVSKLNFGHSQPSLALPSLVTPYPSNSYLTPSKLTGTPNVVGLGLLDLPVGHASGNQGPTGCSAVGERRSILSDETFTEESVYSQASREEIEQSGSRDYETGDHYSTESVLDGLEEELSRSEDWSLDLEPTMSIVSRSDGLNLTSSSFNEESFMRMAASDLGW